MNTPTHDTTLYPSDLTDAEWDHLEPLLPTFPTGRPRVWPARLIVDAVFYLLRTSGSWRMLPREYPPWQTVYDRFRRWRDDGTWEAVHARVRERARAAVGRDPTPSGAVMDSQSVKTTEKGGTRGYDGFKKVKGRRRHLLVDTQGLVLEVRVLPANVSDTAGAFALLEPLAGRYPRMHKLWCDRGYRRRVLEWAEDELGWETEVVGPPTMRSTRAEVMTKARERARAGLPVREIWAGLSLQRQAGPDPRRWVVERTFAWLGRQRRLSKDYELLPRSSEAMVYLAMLRLMLRCLSGAPRRRQWA